MRLKSLEIKGFKSFANETVIHFNADVIGIVGPNGSGKSNVVDAIRWVLGEQKSKELRLDQMTNVIFNGSKKRKPAGTAQVSLTFENTKNLLPTEYNTVTITRVLYRSGESEYRLNDVPCRLKDITSLFLDTGIGSNSYAIIALGMVDDILNDKENSRRKMFEQAAGISKYKVRKRETLSKLEATTADLDRVEDLLFEINKNLQSLEKQAKRTKRYFELKEEYKQISIELTLRKVKTLRDKQNAIQAEFTAKQDQYRGLEATVSALEAKLEADKKANVDQEKSLSDRQRDLNQLTGQIRGLENDKRMLEQKQQFLEQNSQKLERELQQAEGKIQQLEQEIQFYATSLAEDKILERQLEDELDGLDNNLKQIRESHGSLKTNLDKILEGQQALERTIFDLEKQKAVNSNQIENGKSEIQRLQQELENRALDVSHLQEKVNHLQESEQTASQVVLSAEEEEKNRLKDIESMEQSLQQLTQKLNKVNRELDAKRNEYKLTQSMIENLEGFPESIRFLNSQKQWAANMPLLSDILYVPEEYRTAIENYLEPYLNYYVVPNQQTAMEAISLLGRSQKGKANFFLLDAFREYQPATLLMPPGVVASDIIQVDDEYRRLCGFLLERVIIIDQEEPPRVDSGEEMVFLARTGGFIRRRFSMSGGSVGLFEGKKIGRKKNLEILETQIAKVEREADKLVAEQVHMKASLAKLKESSTREVIRKAQQDLNRIQQEKVSLSARLESFTGFQQQVEQKRQQIALQIQTWVANNETIEVELSKQQDSLATTKETIYNTDGSYRAAAEQLSQASSAFNEKNIAFIRQQNKVSTLQREQVFREKQREETRHLITQNRNTLTQSIAEIESLREQWDGLEKSLLEKITQRRQRESALNEVEQAYYGIRNALLEQEDQIRRQNKAMQELQIKLNTLRDQSNDVKFEVSSASQRLRIEFDLDINTIINQKPQDTETPEGELEEKVERMRGRLANYGEINPMAVEAYDEMQERHTSISTQRDDIVQAKESLIKTIKEIEETATEQFLNAFEQVRLSFIEVFRSLFTEDDFCDLILVQPDNPLESNIEIVAKPKGKRPQTINQLSGGEKTLTATALLFALYLLKPAPFCIFDEVDAPLDDANISKFNKIIKKFSKDSQFIIITHNKLTMAAVDTIYGVYMADQGVSGVSPVDFRSFEHGATFEVSAN